MGTSPHPGEIEARRRAGVPDPGFSPSFIRKDVPPIGVEFLERQSVLFVGFEGEDGALWVTPLAGEPGFLTSADRRSVRIETPDVDTNPLVSKLEVGDSVGTLAIDLQTRDRVRLNGVVESRSGGLVVALDEVFSNCPKYIQTREPASAALGPPSSVESVDRKELRRAFSNADALLVVSGNREVGFDVSHRGGSPGFLQWEDGDLVIPDYRGNRLFQTIGNLLVNPRFGMLVVDFETGRLHHATGRAAVDWDAAGAPAVERQIRVDLDETMIWSSAHPWVAPTMETSPHVPPLDRMAIG